MSVNVKSGGRVGSEHGLAPSEGRLSLLWRRLLGRQTSDSGIQSSMPEGGSASGTRHTDAAAPVLAPAPFRPPHAVSPQATGDSEQQARGIRHVLSVVGIAVSTAPSRRQSWTMRLRLREDVLPQCSVTLSVSPDVLQLRFRSSDIQTLALLSNCQDGLGSALTTLVGRASEVVVVDEYFGLA